jgi:hypothetical protein
MFKKFLSSLAKNPWKSYAASIGAEYIDGGFQSDRIIVNDQNVTITVSIGTNQRGNSGFRYTRFRCSYTSSHSPYFSIKPKKFHLMKGLFSKKEPDPLPIQKLYDISAPKEELFSMLFSDDQFCVLLNTISVFKYSSEKDDGEYGPVFLSTEHQFCLELEGEIEEAPLLDAGIGIILATVRLFRNNDLLGAEKSTVQY